MQNSQKQFFPAMLARRIFLLLLLGLIFIPPGTGRAEQVQTIFIRYQSAEPTRLLVPAGKQFNLCLKALPMQAHEDRLWYRIGNNAWFLEKEPTELIGAALELELKRLGLNVSPPSAACPFLLEFQIRWFAPYGHNPASAALILALTLYARQTSEPIWRGRLRAGATSPETASFAPEQTLLIQKTIEEILSRALRQLGWQPELNQIILQGAS
jgi:hypothetical protein